MFFFKGIFLTIVVLILLPCIVFIDAYSPNQLHCHAISALVTDAWCNENCNLTPPNCPTTMCKCDPPPTPPTPAPAPTPRPKGDTWAVLAAGSSTYWNYRHQADVCHAYHVLIDHGVKPDHIIVLMYDDVAHSSSNPFPGKLFNEPKGKDVYTGCVIDYKGDVLSPSLYMHVLLGESEAVKNVVGSGRVLKSGPDDRVFLNFADHGGPGMIMFPGGAIAASDLIATIKKMHAKKMYDQMLFYLDTCNSGSMFLQLPTDINVLAITSSYPGEDANAIYCYAPDNVIQGKSINSCLGDVMSVGWMHDSDHYFDELIKEQVKKVTAFCAVNRCNPVPCVSTVCRYGDLSIENEAVGWFQGGNTDTSLSSDKNQTAATISARDVKVELLRQSWLNASNESTKTVLWEKLQGEITHRNRVDIFFTGLANTVCGSLCDGRELLDLPVDNEDLCKEKTLTDLECHKTLLYIIDSPEDCPSMQWGDYSAKYAGLLANLCNKKEQLGATTEELVDQIRFACQI